MTVTTTALDRLDLPAPTAISILSISTVLERWADIERLACPSTIVTALTYSASRPDMVTLVRADVLEDWQDDLYGHKPSAWWHTFPRRYLEEAVGPGSPLVVYNPQPDSNHEPAVVIASLEGVEGWITITEIDWHADGHLGLRLGEAYSDIYVTAKQIRQFLADAQPTPATAPQA
ncbi:hypothetical protein AB0F17_59585 [Nonomuraea sp. NPDC026600]|uniref:hypothetical protein n=1 Tax=Nonomuraea sp. NPDC026600 TaxID=3155363 RepID=UPI0033FDC783